MTVKKRGRRYFSEQHAGCCCYSTKTVTYRVPAMPL